MLAALGGDISAVSRLVLAVTCLGSTAAAISLARVTHPAYTAHMILVAFWSTWAGVAMFGLALNADTWLLQGIPDRLLIVNLNGAFVVSMGGWTVFALRVWRAAVHDRREQIARQVTQRRRATDL